MESLQRLTHPLLLLSITSLYPKANLQHTPFRNGSAFHFHKTRISNSMPKSLHHIPKPFSSFTDSRRSDREYKFQISRAGWFRGLGEKKQILPDIVEAGDPVLHECAEEIPPEEIGSERIQKIIDDMINVMRKAPGAGLAAPQIGIPLKIIVLEDTEEYIGYAPKELTKAQNRKPFDLQVIINPKLKKKGNKTALFFEGCLSMDGFRAVVERHLEVEVTGLDRNGQDIRVVASGWKARILQHECDHLEGCLYVDKMVPKTFRTAENLELPLATGCPKLGEKS